MNMHLKTLVDVFHATRLQSVLNCESLELDDYGLQAEPFVSPPKWHLAHTSWFFETFILKPFMEDYNVFHPAYEMLFNSYYNAVGNQFPRPQRGLLSRPILSEVMAYRDHVDSAMADLLGQDNHQERLSIIQRCRLGIEHEKQHQELLYTDIKFSLFRNPLYPAFLTENVNHHEGSMDPVAEKVQWQSFTGGLVEIGKSLAPREIDTNDLGSDVFGFDGFLFDCETPNHQVYLSPFALSKRLVNNREFQAFIDDGGYQKPEFWLSDGWAVVQKEQWQQPLYWLDLDGVGMEYTLYGLQKRQPHQPVCHVSGYEADAFASWAKARLPTEQEWEYAVTQQGHRPIEPSKIFHPQFCSDSEDEAVEKGLLHLYDRCWQWTASAFRPYPGYNPAKGALGEYNGKFMSGQWVLRGGSCVTSADHLRPSYRNFFYPQDRWQFSGIRLAK